MKVEANDYCMYCPGNKPPRKPLKKNSKKSDDKSQAVIKVDYKDAGDIWAKAFSLIEKKKSSIRKRVYMHMPFTSYPEEDLLNEALLVAYETLMELAALKEEVPISELESNFMTNFKSKLSKEYQTIPAMRDVMGKAEENNKTACVFYEIKPEENDFSELYEAAEPHLLELLDNEFISALLSVLPLKEEEVMEYIFGITECGKLSTVEIALKIGCSKSLVGQRIASAEKILRKFTQKYKINSSSELEYIKKCAEEYSKEICPKISSFGIFEIGNLLKKVI